MKPKLLLAVSGGVDSMVMAHRFLLSGENFAVASCNFHLRGEEAEGDIALVEKWCSDNGILFHRADFDTYAYAAENGISLEMAARDLRYAFFADLCRSEGYAALAVAHNANDNAETMLLNLLRGTGSKGMRGIASESLIPVPGCRVPMIRPLLDVSREEIEAYALVNHVPFRTDSTNAESEYKRNKVRNLIFPLFREINPSFLKSMTSAKEHFVSEGKALDAYYEMASKSVASVSENGLTIDINALNALRAPEYTLFRLLEGYGFNEEALSSLHKVVNESSTVSGKVFFSGEWRAVTTSSEIIVERIPSQTERFVEVTSDGEYSVCGRRFSIISQPAGSIDPKQKAGVLVLDAEALKFPFTLRGWKEGDVFCPLGLRGSKKLSDFFTDSKYSLSQKEKAVVAVSSDMRITALLCVRPDERARVTPKTSKILVIRELSHS